MIDSNTPVGTRVIVHWTPGSDWNGPGTIVETGDDLFLVQLDDSTNHPYAGGFTSHNLSLARPAPATSHSLWSPE